MYMFVFRIICKPRRQYLWEMEETMLQEILESTVAVARGLEALQSEHEALLTDYYASENIDSSEGTVASTTTDWSFPSF